MEGVSGEVPPILPMGGGGQEGVPMSQVRMEELPISGQDRGWGVTHPRSGWGYFAPPQHQQDGGTPSPPSARWGYTPIPGQDRGGGGYPNWKSIARTCYAAGGMPLAFIHEDFLVH